MMRLLILTPSLHNTSPGSRFRVEQWMPHWERAGVICEHHAFEDEALHRIVYTRGNQAQKAKGMLTAYGRRLRLLPDLRKFDAVFVYEEATRIGPALVERLIYRAGVPMIYDFCDPVYLPYKSPTNGFLNHLKFFGKTATICRLSAQVLAGNPSLAAYARSHNPRVEVVPITIDTEAYVPRKWPTHPPAVPTIGWTGSHTTIPHLDGLAGTLSRLASLRRFRLSVTGAPTYRMAGVDAVCKPWRAATEVADLSEVDIGIMPLPADDWTRLRTQLKVRQYMALGIPCVVSPVGVNTELIQDGVNGFLAHSPQEWIEKLSLLLDNPELRQSIGAAGRKTIEQGYSAAAWAPVVLALIRSAIERRGVPRVASSS